MTIDFIALACRVHIHAGATSHVVERRQIPLLDAVARGRIVEQLSKQVALLDGIGFHARTVGVDVADHEAVAMPDARRAEPVAERIDRIAALQHLLVSIPIHIAHAQLMKFSWPRTLIVTTPSGRVMPVGRRSSAPVVVPSEDVVVMRLVVVAIQAFHDERRMHTIQKGNGKVAIHRSIAVTHVISAIVTRIGVATIVHFAIFQFTASDFCTRQSVDDRYVERTVAHILIAVIHDAVTIYICHGTTHGIESPRFLLLVPETCAIARLDDDLATPIAVDVIGHHHIVLTSTDIHVRTHVNSPKQFARESVSLNLMTGCSRIVALVLRIITTCGSCKEAVAHHTIYLAISIQVHRPDILRAIVVANEHLIVVVKLKPHVAPRLSLVKERIRHRSFHSFWTDSRHSPFGIVSHRRRLVVRHLERLCIHLLEVGCSSRATIQVVGRAFWFLRQLAPRHQIAVSTATCHTALRTLAVCHHHTASHRLLQSLSH